MIECKVGDLVIVESDGKDRIYPMVVKAVFDATIEGYSDYGVYAIKKKAQIIENRGPLPKPKPFKWWWKK